MASTSQARFSRDIWNQVEKSFDPRTQAVIDMLSKIGRKEQLIVFLPEVCKQDTYLSVRDMFAPYMLPEIPKIVIAPPKGKRGKNPPKKKGAITADQIRIRQTTEKVTNEVTSITNSYRLLSAEKDESTNYHLMTGFNTFKYLETKLIALFHLIEYVIQAVDNGSSYLPAHGKNASVEEFKDYAYDMFIGINKIHEHIVTCSNVIGNMENIEQCVKDLMYMKNKLVSKYDITYKTLFESYPKYSQITSYDNFFKSMGIKPYKSQLDLVDIADSPQKSFVLYKTNIGGGKTMTSVALASHCQQKGKQLIFVCSVAVVRTHIAKALYNAGIGFAIGNTTKNITFITRNYNCKNAKYPDAIICDLETAIKLLECDTNSPIQPFAPLEIPEHIPQIDKAKIAAINLQNETAYLAEMSIRENCGSNFITFVDEITVDSERENSEVTDAISKLLFVAPFNSSSVIVSSASMPQNDEIKPIVDHYRRFYGRDGFPSPIREVGSMEIFVGCKLFAGDVEFIPYEMCDTCAKMAEFIDRMKTTKFVDRLLPSNIAFHVANIINKYIPDENKYNLEEYFKPLANLSQTNIFKIIIDMLEHAVSLGNNDIIKEITKRQSYSFACYKNVLSKPILTSEYYKYSSGQTIIACVDPIETAFNLYNNMVNSLSSGRSTDITSIVNNYFTEKGRAEKKINDFRAKHEKQDKSSQSGKKKPIGSKTCESSSSNSSTCRRSMIDIESRVGSISEGVSLDFPKSLQIGTSYHKKMYYPEEKTATIRNGLVLESLPLDMQIQDWIYFLLFCGVGIYDPSNSMLTGTYNDLIMDLVSNNQLAFLVSGKAICYGADLPITSVIIDPEFSRNNSISTLFQLLGRAGRVGSSFVAYGFIDPILYKRISAYIMDTSSETATEGTNISTAFNRHLHPDHSSAIIKHNGHNIEADIEPLSKAIASNSWTRKAMQ